MILMWALDFALAAVVLAMLLCGWRLLRGPETPDRLLALDTLYINAAGRNIRGDQQLQGSFPELSHHFIPLSLRKVSMQCVDIITFPG